jgi:hypothetical protein
VPIGLARSPFVVGHRARTRRGGLPDFGVSTPRSLPNGYQAAGKSSHRLSLPCRVSPTPHRGWMISPGRDQVCSSATSSRGLCPSSVSGSVGSHVPPAGSQPTGCVASSGFGALSTPCSPHSLPSLFHLGSAHGVLPFEVLLLCAMPYALSSAATLMRLTSRLHTGPEHLCLNRGPPLQGLAHRRSRHSASED